MKSKKGINIVQFVGSLLILVGVAMMFFDFDFAKYIFASGTLLLLVVQGLYIYITKNNDEKTHRLNRLMFLVTFLLVAASYCMFTQIASWLPFVLAYAAVSLFLSFRHK